MTHATTDELRYLVVEIVPDLAAAKTTRTGLFAGLAQLAGVRCVYEFNDLTGLTTEQLMAMTRPSAKQPAR